MENLFEASCKLVKDLQPNEDRDNLQERLHNLVEITSGIGWGYHDTLGDIYFEYFPNIILKRGAVFFRPPYEIKLRFYPILRNDCQGMIIPNGERSIGLPFVTRRGG